ncbi:hypothetical protein [Neptunitalea lumnitzerae]|nr:hypothetical protein [Neptunitalea sp. Y10]
MKLKLKLKIGAIVLLALGTLISCDDDEDVVVVRYVYASDDAEEILATSIAYNSYGFVASLQQTSEEIQEGICEETITNSDSFSGANYYGNINYEYSYDETYTNYCSPESYVAYNLDALQQFETYNSEFEHTIGLEYTVTGIEAASDDEFYEGIYARNGSWQALYDEDLRYTFELAINYEEVTVSKSSHKIYEGIATFTLEQVYEDAGVVYTYQGTLEFLNEDEAKVTYDNGDSFIINLNNVSLSS